MKLVEEAWMEGQEQIIWKEKNNIAKVSFTCREVVVACVKWLCNKEGKPYKEQLKNDPVVNCGEWYQKLKKKQGVKGESQTTIH